MVSKLNLEKNNQSRLVPIVINFFKFCFVCIDKNNISNNGHARTPKSINEKKVLSQNYENEKCTKILINKSILLSYIWTKFHKKYIFGSRIKKRTFPWLLFLKKVKSIPLTGPLFWNFWPLSKICDASAIIFLELEPHERNMDFYTPCVY